VQARIPANASAEGEQGPPDTKAGGPTVCAECGGTGRVGPESCDACGGTGDLEEDAGGG
jgi:DnaJ-class molecular chaperone